MEYVTLGKSDLRVSRICMGCMGFGNAATGQHSWTVDEETSKSIIKRGLELGINFYDTAIAYQAGTSEEYLGKAIREYARRDEVVIATKFLSRSQEAISNGVSGKEHVLKSLDASLNHLGMDYVDLYIYHMWDWNTPVEEYLEGMAEGVKAGKIRQIGIANCFAWQLAEANAIAKKEGFPEFVSVQNHYNLIMREDEREMSVYAGERNIALTPYSALAAGRLSKRPGETSKRLEQDTYAKFKYDSSTDKDAKVIARVCEIADARNVSMTEVSLAWLLTKVASPVVGATKISHVEGAVKAVDLQLSDDEIKALEELYEPHFLSGVMAQNTPAARTTEQVWIKNGKYVKQEGDLKMIYKNFNGIKLSALGMGNMRLPVLEGNDSKIDKELSKKMIAYCMESGINYYDTAYGYHGGQSELVVGEILKDYDRNSFYLASKFPGYDLSNMPKVKEIFEEQLKKCQVEYFDFYMFHNVCEMNIDAYLDPKFGIYEFLCEQKKNGRIKHLGFSTHGDIACMTKFLDAYGKDMEFCQIELNYFDYKFQDAKGKVELLDKWNIPVWVMEPVRGGQLATLSYEATAKLKAARPDEDVPAWAFRFLQTIPSVVMTLSGMSNMEQLKANIKTYEENKPLSEAEMGLILDIADDMIAKTTVPCTGCHYCVSKCPKKLDIPFLLKLYNEAMVAGSGDFIAPMALASIDADKQPECCINCHSCEKVCPQTIHIPEELKKFAVKMGR